MTDALETAASAARSQIGTIAPLERLVGDRSSIVLPRERALDFLREAWGQIPRPSWKWDRLDEVTIPGVTDGDLKLFRYK